MKTYTRIYLEFFGYDVSDWIPCECGCGQRSCDIHHLFPVSTHPELKNDPANLCALTRHCHHRAGTDREFNERLKVIHAKIFGLRKLALQKKLIKITTQ